MNADAVAPRPVRLNNPGDIESGQPWIGLTIDQPDGRFCKFATPAHGFRALCKVLLAYQRKDGLTTIRQFITRWAPPVVDDKPENDTAAYIALVADYAGVPADAPADLTGPAGDTGLLGRIAFAISLEEAGRKPDRSSWFTQDQADAGAAMALA